MPRQVIEAELVFTPDGWRRGERVVIDERGRIEAVGATDESPTMRLTGRALLPGMVNAHSHAFQRGLRGRGETFPPPPQPAGSFWTWREAMYRLVESLDEERMYKWSRRAFDEMLAAGVTTVGEFHYVHHDASCTGYAFDDVVLRAAADAGIRIALLHVYYNSGGFGRELTGGQRRFQTPSLDEFWRQIEHLTSIIDPETQSLGIVAHSIRAERIEEIAAIHAEATKRGLVFHMHLEEQPAEIEACLEHYGKTPMALINDNLAVHERTTMVHCTHTAPDDMASYLESGGNVCICPLTEANLGDGLADVPFILKRNGRICLGSDSNARISMLEEIRWLEYGQRLRTQSRGICRDASGEISAVLWRCGTLNGAHALGLDVGAIAPGLMADFAVIDLDHPSLAGCDDESLLTALILGAPDDVIATTCVAGTWS